MDAPYLNPIALNAICQQNRPDPLFPSSTPSSPRGIGLKSQAVFYRLKERCAIFICNGLNPWPLTGLYSHDFNSSHTKPCLAGRQALLFQDYFYRYYKTLPKMINRFTLAGQTISRGDSVIIRGLLIIWRHLLFFWHGMLLNG